MEHARRAGVPADRISRITAIIEPGTRDPAYQPSAKSPIKAHVAEPVGEAAA